MTGLCHMAAEKLLEKDCGSFTTIAPFGVYSLSSMDIHNEARHDTALAYTGRKEHTITESKTEERENGEGDYITVH